MIYEDARRAAPEDRKIVNCICPNRHVWREWFYKKRYYDRHGNERPEWLFARSDGSTCPECGEQDVHDLL